MQNIYILQLQGTGDIEEAFEIAGAFSTAAAAEQRLLEINAEYVDLDFAVFTLEENAQIETHVLNA